MKNVKGEYNEAIIYTDIVEETAINQIKNVCNLEIFKNSKIRIMPDVHTGAGCTIGTTMTIDDAVIPNMVGVDIGCGMETVIIEEKDIDLTKLDEIIHQYIPSGMNIRDIPHPYTDDIDLTYLKCFGKPKINLDRAVKSIGTLGGGNHFIEVDKDEDGVIYIVIHSGSRHLGLEVANYYQDKSYKQMNQNDTEDIGKMIEDYKKQGREKEIQERIMEMKEQQLTDIPFDLAYCHGEVFKDYIHDMKIVQRFAVLNRKAMMDEIITRLCVTKKDEFTTIHNYIDTENMILRKGAVSAQKRERLLIPINMRDGSLICTGKGNPEWNYSAPHGAGRLLSRSAAKKQYTVEQFEESMKGIYTTSVNYETLDECPMAYKDIKDIVENIDPTVEIKKIIKPIYNFKASD